MSVSHLIYEHIIVTSHLFIESSLSKSSQTEFIRSRAHLTPLDAVISNIHMHISIMGLSLLGIRIMRLLSVFVWLLNAVIIHYPHMRQ
jgi:hypothetical protein